MRVVAYLSIVRVQREAVAAVHGALALLPPGRWVLAVSGGRDSMVLLDAMSHARDGEIAAVATFDHGTGAAARLASELVRQVAAARGLRVVLDVMTPLAGAGEARWRAARWRFLNDCSREFDAPVITAHTRDDQIETVVQRLLRDSGPRGLAGMLAPTSAGALHTGALHAGFTRHVVRPLLAVPRSTVAAYAAARNVPFIEDPSNASRAHQRNRVRLELLPALERVHPGFGAWCVELSTRAAAWRAAVDAFADTLVAGVDTVSVDTVSVDAGALTLLGEAEWRVLWPALAARAGVAMDRRGIVRAAMWAPRAVAGSQIPLSGGARIERTASTFVVRPSRDTHHSGTPHDRSGYIFN